MPILNKIFLLIQGNALEIYSDLTDVIFVPHMLF